MLQVWQMLGWIAEYEASGPFGKGPGPVAEAWRAGATIDQLIETASVRITGQRMRREHRHAVAALAAVDPAAKPTASAWRRTGSTQSAIHFAILASEYMAVR
jgi:hypothetical protein